MNCRCRFAFLGLVVLLSASASAQIISSGQTLSLAGVCSDHVAATSFTLTPAKPTANTSVTATLGIKNLCSSGSLNVPWRIARNDTVLASGTVTINAGQTATLSANWMAVSGTFHFYADADPNNTLGDSSTSRANNVPPAIDLTVPTLVTTFDPLVLDLNGDGVNTTGPEDMVWFDLDADGVKDHITWVNGSTQEAFLWVNLTGKNRVDNGAELFGIGTLLPDGSRAQDGFQALAMYDTPAAGGNGDGVINSEDRVWNSLRLWIDANHNGVCEPGETNPIAMYGVDGIPLVAVRTNLTDTHGNNHYLRAQYLHRVNGQLQPFIIDGLSFQKM